MNDPQTRSQELALRERELELKSKESELKQRERALELSAKEADLRQREIKLDKRQSDQSNWRSPAFLAVIALVGTGVTAVAGYLSSLSQERERAQSTLILEAIKTPDSQSAAKNLKFFTQLGFLNDPNHKIRDYIATNEAPTLPTFPPPADLQLGLKVIDSMNQPVSDVQIQFADGAFCPPTGLDGVSKCPNAIGAKITLKKPGYGTKRSFMCTSQVIFFDPGDH